MVEAELLLADLERRSGVWTGSTSRRIRGKEAVAERDWLERVVEALAAASRRARCRSPTRRRRRRAELQALTSKPVLYVANVDEGEAGRRPRWSSTRGARARGCIAVSARIEAELAELAADEAAEMRGELGLAESGLERLVRAAYELLDLITFFTAHRGGEARARALRRGLHRLGRRRARSTPTSRPASCAPR